MIKLYKFNQKKNCYFYDEAWISGDEIIEHIGQVGTRGRTISHDFDPNLSEEDNLEKVLTPARNGGYTEIELEDHETIEVEYIVEGFGSPEDLDKRHELESRLNETLGWTGLGMCDGGSIGSGTMEVFSYVVDFNIAKEVIQKDLKNTKFANYSKIIKGTA